MVVLPPNHKISTHVTKSLTNEFRVFYEQLRCAHGVNTTEAPIARFPVKVVQYIHEVHLFRHGRQRVAKQRQRRVRTRNAHRGPVAVRPRAVHVHEAQKADNSSGQQHLEADQFQANESEHCIGGFCGLRKRPAVTVDFTCPSDVRQTSAPASITVLIIIVRLDTSKVAPPPISN